MSRIYFGRGSNGFGVWKNGISLQQMGKTEFLKTRHDSNGGTKESFPFAEELAKELRGERKNSRIFINGECAVAWGYAAANSGFGASALETPEPKVYIQIRKTADNKWKAIVIKKPSKGWDDLFEDGNKTPIQLDPIKSGI